MSTEGKQVKYGQIYGGENGFDVTVAADQSIKAASGKFVYRTGSTTSTVTLADSTHTELMGHLEIEEFTVDSTDGTEVRKCVNDLTAVFRIPILRSGTYADHMKGKTCDLLISDGVQGAAIDSSSTDVVTIVDGDLESNAWVDVQLNPTKMIIGVA